MPYTDPLIRAAYHRIYKQQNRHRWRAAQQARDAARHANERAAKYGAPGHITTAEARSILEHGACQYCGTTERLGLDHVLPLHAGGPNRIDNLVCCCVPCNASKWRQDRPYRWARSHDHCVICGHADRKHSSQGRCVRCDSTHRTRMRRARGGPT